MGISVGDVFVALGFDVDDKKLKDFDNQLVNVKNNLFGAKEYALAAVYGIMKFAESAGQAAADMGSFTDQTGLSADELQRWQAVAGQLNRNLNASNVSASIKNLAKNINDIQRFGKGNTQPFLAFGIDVSDMDMNAFKALEILRQRIKNYDRPTAVNLLQQMGLDPNFISVLELTNEQFAALAGNLALSGQELDNLDDLGSKVARVTLEFEKFKNQMTAKFSPVIIETIDEIRDRVSNLGEDFAYLEKVKPLIIGIGLAFATWTAPITLTVTAITGLILALQELGRFINGEDNMFDNLNKWLESKLGWQKAAEGALTPGDPRNLLARLQRAAEESQIDSDKALKTFSQPHGKPAATTNNNQRSVVFNNNIGVNSNGDPAAIGQTIADALQNSLKQTNNGYAN